MRRHRFFIFGYYGWKNVGDDAMLYALLQELSALNSMAEFAILSPVPVVIPPQVLSKTKFVKPSPLAVSREILRSSTFVIGGGTHICDYGNRKRVLKILSRILVLVLYSKLLRKKIYFLNNGLGPISTTWGSFLSKSICWLADYISVRDEASYRILQAWGFTDKISLTFDLSALIEPLNEPGSNIQKIRKNNKRILGISVTPVFEIYHRSKERDLLLINEIAKHVNEWLEENPHWEVWLFTFKGRSKDSDVFITQLLQERLQPPERIKLIPYNSDPRRILAQVAQCDAFIGMKYHSCLFAYLDGIPLLVIEYHPKCRALAAEIGLPKHAIISLEEILNGQIAKQLKNLLEHPENFRATLPVKLATKRAKHGIFDENEAFTHRCKH
jgi:polysaccharide pyruvyl transferase CsaB